MALVSHHMQELLDDLYFMEINKKKLNMKKHSTKVGKKPEMYNNEGKNYNWVEVESDSADEDYVLEIISKNNKEKEYISNGDFVLIQGDTESNPYIARIVKLQEKLAGKRAEVQWFFHPSEIPSLSTKLDYKPRNGEIFLDTSKRNDSIDAETIITKCDIKWIHPDSKVTSLPRNSFVFKFGYNGKKLQEILTNPIKLDELKIKIESNLKTPAKSKPQVINENVQKVEKTKTNNKNLKSTKKKKNTVLTNATNTFDTTKTDKNNTNQCTPCKKNSDLIEKTDITSPLNASSYGRFDASFVAMEMLQDEEDNEKLEDSVKLTGSKNGKNKSKENNKTINVPKENYKKTKDAQKRKGKEDNLDIKDNITTLRRSTRKVPKLVIRLDKLPKPEFSDGSDSDSSSKSDLKTVDSKLTANSSNKLNTKITLSTKKNKFVKKNKSNIKTPKTPIQYSSGKSFNSDEIETKVTCSTKKLRNASAIKTKKNLKTPLNRFRTPSKQKNTVTPIVIKMPGNVTPYIRTRPTPARTAKISLEKARLLLHVSATPESLPCREEEYQEVFGFVQGMIESGGGGCMYVSGVPGTGKTATVNEVMENLQAAAAEGEIPNFLFAKINGMSLTEPRQAYVQLLQQITGEKVSFNHAADRLTELFSMRRKQSVVLLADELDLLWTKKQDVMYHLFDWPTNRHAKFIVVAVANTMDLPERMLMNRVASRLGLTRLTFKPYTFKQLQEIVATRLKGLDVFEPDAIQLVSRKVAAVSGDARRCLDICRRAAEIAEKSGTKRVGIENVHFALQEMFATPMIKAIRSASQHEQMFLRAIVAEYRRLGVEEATLGQIMTQHTILSQLEGWHPISNTAILMMANRLSTCRIILMEAGRRDLYARIRLNLSVDDVLFSLNS